MGFNHGFTYLAEDHAGLEKVKDEVIPRDQEPDELMKLWAVFKDRFITKKDDQRPKKAATKTKSRRFGWISCVKAIWFYRLLVSNRIVNVLDIYVK